jgi:hypothetical protein
MCEAQDVDQPSLMRLLCTQGITGLDKQYLQALGDSLLRHIEASLKPSSTVDEIMTLFSQLDQRIRARCKQFLTSMREGDEQMEDKATMYHPQQGDQKNQQGLGQHQQDQQPRQHQQGQPHRQH